MNLLLACVRASLVMLFNAMPDTIKCIHKFLQTSRVDRRRAKTNVHTLVINPSMILTSTLVPGGTLDDKVQFRLIPRLPSVLPIHGRYGHTGTIHSVDTNLWLWVSVIRSKIHHRRGYQSSMGVFGDPPGPYAALLKIRINLISPHLDNNNATPYGEILPMDHTRRCSTLHRIPQ